MQTKVRSLRLCHTQEEAKVCLFLSCTVTSLCRLAGQRDPIFKIHWCCYTWESCCHCQWKHIELRDAAMSQSLQTERLKWWSARQKQQMSKDSKNEPRLHFITRTTVMTTIQSEPRGILLSWLDCLSFCLIVNETSGKFLVWLQEADFSILKEKNRTRI